MVFTEALNTMFTAPKPPGLRRSLPRFRRPVRLPKCPRRLQPSRGLGWFTAVLVLVCAFGAIAAEKEALVPLKLKLPVPAFIGTPADIPPSQHLEVPSEKPRPAFLAPQGVTNIALHKPVTCSDPNPLGGKPDLVTDGDKEATDSGILEMHSKRQWVQIDLGRRYAIFAILVWHAHDNPQVFRDVVVQVSDDPTFGDHVLTVYNNDFDNSSGFGPGTDKEYFESYEGRLIDVKGVSGRYVRLYSNGSTHSPANVYTEVEVYGLDTPPKGATSQ
jgi:hypothetical protein